MNFQVYTMYVNGQDFLLHAINSVDQYQARTVILDNSPLQDLSLDGFSGEIYRPPVPLFVSQSYNLILALAQERQQDAFFLMHSDAEASNEVIEAMLERAEELNRDRVRWGVMFTNYDVLCLCNTVVVKDFQWDPYLPVYYTDVDFYRRLRLAGIALIETNLPVQHLDGGSSTMKADPALNHFIQSNFPGWRDYYMRKWGGERDQETFATPFNQQRMENPLMENPLSPAEAVEVILYPRSQDEIALVPEVETTSNSLTNAYQLVAHLPGEIVQMGCASLDSVTSLANECFPRQLVCLDTGQDHVVIGDRRLPGELSGGDKDPREDVQDHRTPGTFAARFQEVTLSNVCLVAADGFYPYLDQAGAAIAFCYFAPCPDHEFIKDTVQNLLPRVALGGMLCGTLPSMPGTVAGAQEGQDVSSGLQGAHLLQELLPGVQSIDSFWYWLKPERDPDSSALHAPHPAHHSAVHGAPARAKSNVKIYINNFNLLTWPRKMAEILSHQGHEVIFIDNASTYAPLLQFYENCPYKIHRLSENVGSLAPWICHLVDTSDYYVVTDPDLALEGIPDDWLEVLKEGIQRYGNKCGFSLDETQVPSSNPAYLLDEFHKYPEGSPLIWGNQLPGNYYGYPTDTTFALYAPTVQEHFIGGIRSGRPYTARHLPWHIVLEKNPSENTFQIEYDDEMYHYYANCVAHSRSVTMHRMANITAEYKRRHKL